MMRVTRPLWTSLYVLLVCVAAVQAGPYTIVNVADNQTNYSFGKFKSFSPVPAVSNGVTALEGSFVGGHGVFTSDGDSLTTIVKSGQAAPTSVKVGSSFAENMGVQ